MLGGSRFSFTFDQPMLGVCGQPTIGQECGRASRITGFNGGKVSHTLARVRSAYSTNTQAELENQTDRQDRICPTDLLTGLGVGKLLHVQNYSGNSSVFAAAGGHKRAGDPLSRCRNAAAHFSLVA